VQSKNTSSGLSSLGSQAQQCTQQKLHVPPSTNEICEFLADTQQLILGFLGQRADRCHALTGCLLLGAEQVFAGALFV
jgi:hypothetical protein